MNNPAEGMRAQSGQREREAMYAASDREREAMRAETAAYRLGPTDAKFASTSSAAESQLAQATVGLVSMAEFARRRQAIEDAETTVGAEQAAPMVNPALTKKGKKKKAAVGALSFSFDDEDGAGGDRQPESKPKKLKKQEGGCRVNDEGKEAVEVDGRG